MAKTYRSRHADATSGVVSASDIPPPSSSRAIRTATRDGGGRASPALWLARPILLYRLDAARQILGQRECALRQQRHRQLAIRPNL